MEKNIEEKYRMIKILYDDYGFKFPYKARYIRETNRIYFATDFKDGEEITFFWIPNKPSACANGYAFYINDSAVSRLVHIDELYSIE